MPAKWTPESWRSHPIRQVPAYRDAAGNIITNNPDLVWYP